MRFKLLLSVAGACLFWLAAFLVHRAQQPAPVPRFDPQWAAVPPRPAPYVVPAMAPMAPAPILPAGPVAPVPAEGPLTGTTVAGKGPRIQLALLLDVSGSMGGLIEQAKTQLWSVVNRLSEASRSGVRPALEIALYTYGDAFGPREIRRVLPFTTDLDLLSENLFALTTSGGFEPAGEVILRSVRELQWTDASDSLRLIVIAGNEEFDQGEVDFRAAIRSATGQQIVVSTVLCGDDSGTANLWREAAILGGGRFLTIDHNQALAKLEIPAPQDEALAELGRKLNTTYLPYGAHGARGMARQHAQDSNAFGISLSNMASRALSKASAMYDNSGWDLVDAYNSGRLGKLDEERLPEELRRLDEKERHAYIAAKAEERASLRGRIQELSAEREAFLAAERRKRGTQELSLATAILEIARAQGLRFPAQG